MKILIIQTGSIGQVVQSTPIIRALNKQLDKQPDFLIQPDNTFLLEENPYIGKTIKMNEINLSTEKYDLVIDLINNKLSKKWAKRLGKQVFIFRSRFFKEWLLTSLKINQLPNQHIISQQFEMLLPLGIEEDEEGLDYFLPEKDYVEEDWLPESHREGFAVLAMSAETVTQQLPVDRMIELSDRINKPIVLLGDKKDTPVADQIEAFFKRGTPREEEEIEELNKKAIIFNGCGKFNINQQASIIEKSNWVFAHENHLMHIAAAFKKPIYSFWGSSSPLFGEYPYDIKFTIFENNKLNCRPCSRTGFDSCPKGHFKCMKDVTFDFYLPD